MSLWYKRYPADAYDGMRCLTLQEIGAYNTVLDLIYMRGAPIYDDERFLAGMMGCRIDVWRRIRGRLVELGKLISRDGKLTNRRAERELELRREWSERSSRGGKISSQKLNTTSQVVNKLHSGCADVQESVSNKNNDLTSSAVQPLKTQNETLEEKKESKSFSSSGQSTFRHPENVVSFESASRSPPSAGESGLTAGQEERPVQRASDFATDDGNVVITNEQFIEWDQRYPAVSNKRGRLRHAARSWLDEREQSKFEQRFESYLGNEQRKAAAKAPKQTASEKHAAEQASKDRQRRSDAAAEFQKRQDEKIRQRRAAAQR
jgi:uncharacterized protein YdaU (DUF1376 family)